MKVIDIHISFPRTWKDRLIGCVLNMSKVRDTWLKHNQCTEIDVYKIKKITIHIN